MALPALATVLPTQCRKSWPPNQNGGLFARISWATALDRYTNWGAWDSWSFMTPSIRWLTCSVLILLVGTGCASTRAPQGPPGPNGGPNLRPLPPQAVDLQRNIQFMLSFDENKDGIVTRDELEAGLKRQFAAADLNGDGKLDQSETQAENDRRWRESGTASSPLIDWNQDGVVDFAEFASTVRTLFEQLDRNRSGTLAGVELRVPVARRPPPERRQERRS